MRKTPVKFNDVSVLLQVWYTNTLTIEHYGPMSRIFVQTAILEKRHWGKNSK